MCASRRVICFTIVIAVCTSATLAGDPMFTGVGTLGPGATGSVINGLSRDGTTAVGFSNSPVPGGGEAFHWTFNGGIVGIGVGPSQQSIAYGVSNGGSVITGDAIGVSGSQSFAWNAPNTFTVIGDIPGGGDNSLARAVSADGTTIVGQGSSNGGLEAYRWSQQGGFEPLGFLPGGDGYSLAFDVSTDGNVVVGESDSQDAVCFACPEAFRWTPGGGMQALGDLPGGEFRSSARATNPDGTVIVGQSLSGDGGEAFRWTDSTGMVGIGDLDGGAFESRANGVSADGSMIVGQGSGENGVTATIWTEETGMITIEQLVTGQLGLDITGWQLIEATGISDDGSIIVGNGINPAGGNEGWAVRVPEPATALILALGVIATGRRPRR